MSNPVGALAAQWRTEANVLRRRGAVAQAVVFEQCAGELEAGIIEPLSASNQPPPDMSEPTWRERLWTAPAESRIGRDELLEAVGRPASWLYRHTSQKGDCARIPHRKMDNELVFVVGEVRQWLCEHEEIVVQGRSKSFAVPAHRGKGAA